MPSLQRMDLNFGKQGMIRTFLDRKLDLDVALDINNVTCMYHRKNISLEDALSRLSHKIERLRADSRCIFVIGNGGSAAIASHLVNDLVNVVCVRALALQEVATMTCQANDFGYEHIYARQIRNFANQQDLVIAISSSGNSPNILNAISVANELECETVAFSAFNSENKCTQSADLSFHVPTQNYMIAEIAHLFLVHTISEWFANARKF